MTDRLRETVGYIRAYHRGRDAPADRDRAWLERATAEARQWQPTGITADDAATLANKGWTPERVRPLLEAAYEEGDERDREAELDRLLYGPGPDEADPTA